MNKAKCLSNFYPFFIQQFNSPTNAMSDDVRRKTSHNDTNRLNNNRTQKRRNSDDDEPDVRAIRDFFLDAANIDASGFIDEAELAAVVDLSADEIRQIFDTLDQDGDGKISIEQFTQYYKEYQQQHNDDEDGEDEQVNTQRFF